MKADYDLETMTRELELVLKLPIGCHGTIYAALRDAWQMGRAQISYAKLKERQDKDRELTRDMEVFL